MTLPNKPDFTNDYGGPKQNAGAVEDATTDLDATQGNNATLDAAMLGRVPAGCWVRFTGTTVAGVVVVTKHDALWGVDAALVPTVTKTATTGKYSVSWPATIVDELGVTRTVVLDHAKGFQTTASGGVHPFIVMCQKTGSHSFDVWIWDHAVPGMSDGNGVGFCVRAYI